MGPSPMRTQTRVVPRTLQIAMFSAADKCGVIRALRKLDHAALDRHVIYAILTGT